MSTSRDDSPGARQCPACSADSGEPVLAGPDGRCTSCGQPLVINADHVEKDLGQVVGVSDRGLRHHRNEDAFHIAVVPTAAGQVAVAIVSDGVSSAPRPDEASLMAVRTAMGPLAEGVQRGDDPAEASLTAVNAAARALTELAGADGAPAATYVSAVVSQELITICWLGDSRAYWLAAEGLAPGGPNDTIDITGGSRRITRDDSLAEEMVAAGLTPTGPGVLLVCSDGLWNYRQEAAELAVMAMPAALERPLDAAADLVKFAIDSGGLDNITVVLIPFPPR
jgi:serine/threonine protein phosphatase PrpC